MVSLRDAMDRLFEESFFRPGRFFGESAGVGVPLDAYETDENWIVKAAAPGIKPEELEVTVTGDLLTIKGEFRSEERNEKRSYLRQERRFGSFCRQLTLPGGTDPNKVRATFENGVLTLELPKVDALKPKTVKIMTK
jgi:HSP20 family protein